MGEICTDNRFELIQKYKEKLIQGTNIETAKEEMAVIDNILFRFWQMGWLDILERDEIVRPVCKCGHLKCGNCGTQIMHGNFCYVCGKRIDRSVE